MHTTEDKISSIVKTKHNDINDNFYGYEENPFVLVKKGNNWLIDKYVNLINVAEY